MNDYIFYTREKDFLKSDNRTRIFLFLKTFPLVILVIIFTIITSITLIYDKKWRYQLKDLWISIMDFYKEFGDNDTKATYNFLNNNISINLECYGDSEKEIIKDIIETITHEDLHKAIGFISSCRGQHFVIKKMLE